MLIRANSLTEATKSKLFNEPQKQQSLYKPTEVSAKPSAANPPVKPQNRYESIFIKLFAQKTLHLILSFSTIFFSIIFLRDLIGLRISLFKFSFWFQFSLSLTFFIVLIFAKMKFFSNDTKVNPLSNPFDYYFNQDQLSLIIIWTLASFYFGSWYFRQYAPQIYKLYDHIKGQNNPVLREQCFLIWATLLCQGIVSWFMFLKSSSPIKPHDSKMTLINFLKTKLQNVTLLPSLLNKSSLILITLIIIHLLFAWFAFPIFGFFLSNLFDLQQPIRHSWTSILRIGLFVHLFSFSIISNLIYSISDWLIEFYLSHTFRTSALVPDSEHVLAIGLSQTKQNFIHLQACREFYEIATDSNGFRRYKIYSSVEDEGSLSREILDWFTSELRQVKDRADSSFQELNSFFSILGSNSNNSNNNIELPNSEILRQYHERTIGLLELVLKRIFNNEKAKTTNVSIPTESSTTTSGLPEIFARRGPMILQDSQNESIKKESIPLMFEFGPFLQKHQLGRLLISYWIASRKVYCIERFEMLKISIKSIESFICASFIEDENGQVQLTLPKVLETSIETMKSLKNLLETSSDSFVNDEVLQSDAQIETILELLKEMLKNISITFGETLENVRISSQCREFIKSL